MKRRLIALILATSMLLVGCEAAPKGCEHRDSEDDGYCDRCYADLTEAVNFYSINDLHGKFDDTDKNEGVDELTTYLKAAEEKYSHTVMMSSGDMWQGSAESNSTDGLIITDWMNELGFDCMTLGNHEYDWGEESIEANAAAADFPFLAINIYERSTNLRAEYCEASIIVDCGNVQVGIIGAMGDCYSSISSDKTEDVYFKVGDELTELVMAESERLRANGADVIVYSLHDGYTRSRDSGVITESMLSSYYDLALSDGYIDLVFEAHTHQSYVLQDEHGVYHLQGGGDNDGITHARLDVNWITGTVRTEKAELIRTGAYASLNDDPIVDELLQKYEAEIAVANRVVGINNVTRGSTLLRNLIAELYYEYGVERWGEQYDIAVGGGFISIRSPYELEAGEVKYGELQMLFPFDNEIVLCSIRGSDLRRRFLETDNGNYYVYQAESLGTIDDSAIYYVVTDTYCSQYQPNRLTVIESYGQNIFARDLLASYINDGGLS